MGDLQGIDYTVGVLQDPFEHFHMGITAENVAARQGISREMQDELALTSQRRAAAPRPKAASTARSCRWS